MNNLAIRLVAPNDSNGNPRRVYIVFDCDEGDIVGVVDEGYSGKAVLKNKWQSAYDKYIHDFEVSGSEYKAWLREAGLA